MLKINLTKLKQTKKLMKAYVISELIKKDYKL